jgi:N-acetylglucosamine-6-sulfatase
MRGVVVALVLAAASAAAALAGTQDSAAVAAASRPNVVVLMTDDQRADELGPMRTVRRELAARGVSFTNAYATFPLCCPSRATFLTGQYAHNHGVLSNEIEEGGGYPAYDDSGSLPIALQVAGYRTGAIGKYLNEYEGPEIPDGWSYWAVRTRGQTLFDYRLNVNGKRVEYGSRTREYQTDVIARRGARFIHDSAGSRPFFLWTSFFAPHGENLPGPEHWNPRPAPRHRGRYASAGLPRGAAFDERDVGDKPGFVRRARRLSSLKVRDLTWRYRSRQAALLSVDDAVQTLLRALRQTGELDDTLVVFVSDNAFAMGEHRLEGKNLLYEEVAKVPLVIRGPGIPQGAVAEQIVGNIDLAPTILDAAGVPSMREPDGISLLPLAADPDSDPGRDLLLENEAGGVAIRTDEWMYAEHRNGERELYDLSADPDQLESLHEDPAYSDVLEDLASRLDALRTCAGGGCR